MFERGLTRSSIDGRLLARILTQIDLVSKEGFASFSGSYSYPFKKNDLRIEICLSKACQREGGSDFKENFYQEVKISIPPNSNEKIVNQINRLREELEFYLKNKGFEKKN